MNRSVENSIFFKQLGDLKEVYLTMEAKINSVYLKSFTQRLIKKINETIKVCFRYSFLGRITEPKQAPPMVLDNSRAVRYSISFYKKWRDKTIHYLRSSFTFSLAKDTKEQFVLSPVRIISLIVIITIFVNAVLSVILQKQMYLWSFLIRVLFLFAGTAGLSCEADWPTVKKSSVLLKKMRMD